MLSKNFSDWFWSVWERVQVRIIQRSRSSARHGSRACRSAFSTGRLPVAAAIEKLEARQLLSAILVNSLDDNTTSGDGKVTLREAIAAANSDSTTDLGDTGSGADTISFDSSLFNGGPATINLSIVGDTTVGPSGLAITSEITIIGPSGANGLSIARDSSVSNLRLFYVGSTGNLTLQDLTLSGGRAQGNNGGTGGGQGGGGGGAAGMGGALFNDGAVKLLNSTLSGNTAVGGAGGAGGARGFRGIGGGGGGGLTGPGQDAIVDQTVGGDGGSGGGGNGGNGVGSGGGQPGGAGAFGSGGGGGGYGVSPPTGIGGVGGFGGGAGGSGGNAGSSTTSAFGGGRGGVSSVRGGGGGGGAGLGGAIFNNSGASLTISNSTLSGNTAQGGAGGATSREFNGIAPLDGTAGQGLGGAVFNLNGTVTLTNSTISTNTATDGGRAVYLASNGSGNTATAVINNSILGQSDNSISDFDTTTVAGGNAPTSSGTNNLIRNQTTFGGTSLNVDPKLGLLTSNGGPTQTMALLVGSPALGTAGALTTLSADITDQAATTFTVNDATSLVVGNALRIENEIVLVTAISGTTITVDRGQMSTTATTHSSGTDLTLATDQRGFLRPATGSDIGSLERQPAVLTNGGAITYVENDPATAIDTGIVISGQDSETLASATVTLTNVVTGEDLLSFTNDSLTMGNISGSYNSATGVLTLTSSGATATQAEWQAALRAVTYANTSDKPSTTQRSVEFVVNNGAPDSNVVTSTINITAVNDAPVVSGIETAAKLYAPNAAATTITSTLTLGDLDNTNLTGATVSIAGYQAGDTLIFTDTPNITGAFAAGTLTLSGTDTVANYEAALRSIKYVSSSNSPAARTISFQVTDGTDSSNIATRVVGGYAQLNGTTLIVYGTDIVNNITVSEGATLDVTVDSALTQFTPAQVTSIAIFGFDGDDTILINSLTTGTSLTAYGMKGNDTIRVSAAVTQGVTLNGAAGNDLLIGGSGNDLLLGGGDNDWLNGGDGYDTLTGGTGDDAYAFSDTSVNQIDTVNEQNAEGTDTLTFSTVTEAVTVDLTSDTTLATTSHRIVQVGSAGQSANFENVFGGSANDFIIGNAVNNLLLGNGGNDTLKGGDGNDYLDGGQGADLLMGGNNDDFLIGGIGDDYLMGEGGNDLLDGADGYNAFAGGVGDDRYIFRDATVNQVETIIEQSAEGTDTLDFSALTNSVTVDLTSDTLTAFSDHRIVQAGVGQSANFENVLGGSGHDQITGNAANNLLSGNGGNDTITGNDGNDILLGGQGNDTLKGIIGRNILIGGTGADLLLGGTDSDLLLSGSSVYESDPAVLGALLAEWASGNTYQMRVDHLLGTSGGGANTSFVLSSATVTNDSDADYLTGGTGQDWFLANSRQDVLTDKAIDEVFTQIDSWF